MHTFTPHTRVTRILSEIRCFTCFQVDVVSYLGTYVASVSFISSSIVNVTNSDKTEIDDVIISLAMCCNQEFMPNVDWHKTIVISLVNVL